MFRFKKKEKTDDPISEAWDDIEEKGSSLLKDVVPPPLPPTKDEMAQNLKKIVEKKKESVEAKPASTPVTAAPGGPSVMDKLGGFRINPAAVSSTNNNYRKDEEIENKRKPSRARDSESDSERDEKDKGSVSSRSRSRTPKRKYSSGESSEGSYKGRSRSKSGSYTRPRRYRSSESGSYRSRSYSRSRSRSRSGDYRRSRSRSDDRSYRSKYPPGRYPRNRGTYYRPRFQNSGNFKNRGYGNRMGYRRGGYGGGYRDYGSRDYRNRGFNPRNRGRGRGQRYFTHRRDYRDYKRHDRGVSRSDDDRDDSPMRKVDAAKERIDKLISQEHSGPLSEGEDRDEDYKWGGGSKEESNPNTSAEKI